jgi:hypothetical protein
MEGVGAPIVYRVPNTPYEFPIAKLLFYTHEISTLKYIDTADRARLVGYKVVVRFVPFAVSRQEWDAFERGEEETTTLARFYADPAHHHAYYTIACILCDVVFSPRVQVYPIPNSLAFLYRYLTEYGRRFTFHDHMECAFQLLYYFPLDVEKRALMFASCCKYRANNVAIDFGHVSDAVAIADWVSSKRRKPRRNRHTPWKHFGAALRLHEAIVEYVARMHADYDMELISNYVHPGKAFHLSICESDSEQKPTGIKTILEHFDVAHQFESDFVRPYLIASLLSKHFVAHHTDVDWRHVLYVRFYPAEKLE